MPGISPNTTSMGQKKKIMSFKTHTYANLITII